jgi:hypothetical protein
MPDWRLLDGALRELSCPWCRSHEAIMAKLSSMLAARLQPIAAAGASSGSSSSSGSAGSAHQQSVLVISYEEFEVALQVRPDLL